MHKNHKQKKNYIKKEREKERKKNRHNTQESRSAVQFQGVYVNL